MQQWKTFFGTLFSEAYKCIVFVCNVTICCLVTNYGGFILYVKLKHAVINKFKMYFRLSA